MQTQNTPSPLWPKPLRTLARSLFLGIFILVSYLLFWKTQNDLAVACLGSSAFIAFFLPHEDAARPGWMLGSYLIGLAVGFVCQLVLHLVLHRADTTHLPVTIAVCAVSVLVTGFLIEMLNLLHPPAAALSIIMVTREKPVYTAFLIMAVMLGLLAYRWLVYKTLGPKLNSQNSN